MKTSKQGELMLNSTMQSRKKEVFVEMKESIMDMMVQKERLRKTCKEKIDELENQHINWYGKYISVAMIVLSVVGAGAFIRYGYSSQAWSVFSNVLLITLAGLFAYLVIIYNQFNTNKKVLSYWQEIESDIKNELSAGRKTIKTFNNYLYSED